MSEYVFELDVPFGEQGEWKIEPFTVTKLGAAMSSFGESVNRYTPPGEYIRLSRGRETIMSNTPAEIYDLNPFVDAVLRQPCERILINGLGLGIAIERTVGRVQKITVIEKSADVIALVADHYRRKYGDKIEVIHADAFDYQPPKGVRYGAVWHDIWDNICTDNLPEMARLHRKYARRTDWQGSWCRTECLQAKRLSWAY